MLVSFLLSSFRYRHWVSVLTHELAAGADVTVSGYTDALNVSVRNAVIIGTRRVLHAERTQAARGDEPAAATSSDEGLAS